MICDQFVLGRNDPFVTDYPYGSLMILCLLPATNEDRQSIFDLVAPLDMIKGKIFQSTKLGFLWRRQFVQSPLTLMQVWRGSPISGAIFKTMNTTDKLTRTLESPRLEKPNCSVHTEEAPIPRIKTSVI
jgi:hypothetical protein